MKNITMIDQVVSEVLPDSEKHATLKRRQNAALNCIRCYAVENGAQWTFSIDDESKEEISKLGLRPFFGKEVQRTAEQERENGRSQRLVRGQRLSCKNS
ncbi:hypothetical protein JTB14_002924 [Gonioctena quinquepunctata]|nr:hypothetical protein JTB14_002924 [Gonioctena quinquepunctata]